MLEMMADTESTMHIIGRIPGRRMSRKGRVMRFTRFQRHHLAIEEKVDSRTCNLSGMMLWMSTDAKQIR